MDKNSLQNSNFLAIFYLMIENYLNYNRKLFQYSSFCSSSSYCLWFEFRSGYVKKCFKTRDNYLQTTLYIKVNIMYVLLYNLSLINLYLLKSTLKKMNLKIIILASILVYSQAYITITSKKLPELRDHS